MPRNFFCVQHWDVITAIKAGCAWIVLLSCLCMVCKVEAHPHIWVEYSVRVHFTEHGLAGFTQQWKFDEMFTNELKTMHQLSGEGALSADEVVVLQQKAFQNLRDYNYFTYISIDGQPFDVQYVTEFNAWLDGHNLVYEFFVPCTVAAIKAPKSVQLLVFDTEFFVDVSMVNTNPVQVNSVPGVSWHKEIEPDDAFRFLGFLKPPVLTIQFWKQ